MKKLIVVMMSMTAIFACKKDNESKSANSKLPPVPEEKDKLENTKEDSSDDSADPKITSSVAGSVAIDLGGATAVGIASVDSDSKIEFSGDAQGQAGQVVLSLTDTPTKYLTKIDNDGRVVALRLPDLGGTLSEIKDITSAGEHGFIVMLENGGYFKDQPQASMIWLKAAGEIVPFAPENYSDGVANIFWSSQHQVVGDKFWINNINQNALWNFDFKTTNFSKFTDENQKVNGFLLPSNGAIFMQVSTKVGGSDFGSMILRHLKINGGLEEFATVYGKNQIDDSMVIADKALIYGQFVDVVDGNVSLSFSPHRLPTQYSGRSDNSIVVGDQWIVSHFGPSPVAVNATATDPAFAIAGNPFSQQASADFSTTTMLEEFISNVNHLQSLHFDGANLVNITKGSAGVVSKLALKLRYPAGRTMRVLRVFGEDHGFDGDTYGAFAVTPSNQMTIPIKLWWVEIEKDSGLVLANDAIEFIDPKSSPFLLGQMYTAYNVADKIVAFEQSSDAASLSWLVMNGDGKYEFVKKKGTNVSGDYLNLYAGDANDTSYNHAYATVYQDKLYFARYDGVGVYDPTNGATGSITLISSATMFGSAAVLDEDVDGDANGGTTCSTNNYGDRHVGAVMRTDANGAGGPAIIVRLCKDGATTLGKLAYAKFTDWSFVTAVGTTLDLGETRTETQTERRFPEPTIVGGGEVLFVKRWKNQILHADLSTTTAANVVTTGIVRFGSTISEDDGILIAAPWSTTSFFISGKNSANAYRSYRVNLATRTETHIGDLDGIQVYSATAVGSTMIINGLRLADNVRVSITYDVDGNKIGIDEVSNVQIVKLVPVTPKI